MKYEFTVLILWVIALVSNLLLTKDSDVFTFLLPVYAICMIGSVVTVRRARRTG